MNTFNLNELVIETDDGSQNLVDYSTKSSRSSGDNVEVIFKNLESRLIEVIEQFEDGAIFGCIAWLTSKPILKALSKCDIVQIVVQKEDFLRPDFNIKNINTWKRDLRLLYSQLKCNMERYQFREPIGHLSVCGDPIVQAIRCVGNHNFEKQSAFPRSHHKFLVFCKMDEKGNYFPVTVWTGSFNLTFNATQSFENAIILSDQSGENQIINAYLQEHHQIFALSEQLNWESEWSAPEFRIGT
ncbi:MAG TPA: hypothetical protein VE978_04005 [Chitinophagales bacterium]|nr:hypothetical protein [Chitinophagales bacterium]